MTTPYSEVYSRFLSKVTDYSFLNISSEELEDNLKTLLLSSITKFKKCRTDLKNRNDDIYVQEFNSDLTEDEKEILGTLMVVEYLTPKLVTSDLLQQTLSSKDYSLYSQANHIKELRELRDYIKKESQQLLISYSYDRNLDDMK